MLDLASRLMPLLLAGEHPTCALLRAQYARASITEIVLTGGGVFVDFEISADVARVAPPNFEGGYVNIRVEGVENDAGCLRFVRDGVIAFIDGHTYTDEWPEHPVVLELRHSRPILSLEDGTRAGAPR